jgi:pimeloyl-ACP methyl ester carboxylesterase
VRWLRRLGLAVVELVVFLTVASLIYNAATSGRDRAARKLYAGPYVQVDGTAIAYRRWGRDGSPVVLVSGFIEPSWVWQKVGTLLGRRHHVYALDLPPFGFSERRGPYTLAHWTQLVLDFEKALRISRPILVGHSLGAAVVVSAEVADPRSAAGVVLLDGDALPGGHGPGFLTDLLVPPWYTSVYRIVTGSDWIFRRGLRSAWGSGSPPFTNAFIAAWQRPFQVQGTAAAFASMIGHGVQGVDLATLRRVRGPRVVVWGAQDHVDSVDAGRRTAAVLHARFVAIPGAGHLSMLAAPRAVARAISRSALPMTRAQGKLIGATRTTQARLGYDGETKREKPVGAGRFELPTS